MISAQDGRDDVALGIGQYQHPSPEGRIVGDNDTRNKTLAQRARLGLQHWAAMVAKRIQYSRREWVNQCCGTVCPSVALLFGLMAIAAANAARLAAHRVYRRGGSASRIG